MKSMKFLLPSRSQVSTREDSFKSVVFKTTVFVFVLVSSFVSIAAQTRDDDLNTKSIEELMNIKVGSVYSASKYSQKVTEAPASVSIVTAEQIQRYGYHTLADILASVRGFYVTNDRNYSYVGVRGFGRPGDYNTRVLLLVDGHRINDNVYDQAFIGRDLPIEIDLIERVEIVRGSSSSLYGTSAFFAVINVITKRGRDVGGIEVSAEKASFGTYKGRLTYGNKLSDDFELLLSGSYYDSRGQKRLYFKEFDSPTTNNGIANNADDEGAHNFFATVSFRDFTLRGIHGSREKTIPTASFGTVFNDPRTRTKDRRSYLDLQYDHTFSNQVEIMGRASYDSYLYDGTYVYELNSDTPQTVINKDYSRGRWWSGEVQLTKTVSKHRLTLGSEFRDNLRQNQGNYDLDPSVQYLDDRRTSKNLGFYFQDEFRIRENLSINAGARYDHYSSFGGTAKPRVALIYHPLEKTTVKLLYGEAFRAPNTYELYYGSTGDYKTNPDLKPETIRTGELVFEKYLGDHFRLSASGYVYRIKGLINQSVDPPDGLITFRNQEQVASKGLEFEIEGRFRGGFEGYFAYTVQETRDRATGQELTNSPRQLGKLNIIAPVVPRKLFAGFEIQSYSRRNTVRGEGIPAYYLSNLNFSTHKLASGFDASFGIYNLFNQKYSDPAAEEHRQNAIDQNGRNFRLKFTYHF